MAKKKIPKGLEQFVGSDIEVRSAGGGLVRGRLLAVTPEALVLERHCGRLALVMRAAVSMLLDEQRLPSAAGVLDSRAAGGT